MNLSLKVLEIFYQSQKKIVQNISSKIFVEGDNLFKL